MKILISANSYWNFYNFRSEFIDELRKRNHQVILIAPYNKFYVNFFKKNKIICETIIYKNKSYNIFVNIYSFFQIIYKLIKIRPDVLINFTIKINIFFSLASLIFNYKVINNITGLGTGIINSKFQKFLVIILLRISLIKSNIIFFQNNNDKNFFLKHNIIPENKTKVLKFFGIDISKYKFTPLLIKNKKNLNFLYFGRIIKDKGVYELIDAIKLVKKKFPETTFTLLGKIDYNNPGHIKKKIIDSWVESGLIKYLNFTHYPNDLIAKSDCVILPSYMEGLPKSILESLCIGRPAIVTDVPGCVDLVTENYNGFVCMPRDSLSLEKKILSFINLTHSERVKMSINSVDFVSKNFQSKSIINEYINILSI